MHSEYLNRTRKRVGYGILVSGVLVTGYLCSPGLPVLWGPWARASTREGGRTLFEHEWEPNDPLAAGDGLGPVFNAKSCAACHFQGGLGGSGPVANNVLAFEVHPTPHDPEVHSGVVHHFSVVKSDRETRDLLHKLYPEIPARIEGHGGCKVRIPEFNPVRFDTLNSPALFGAGWIDRISAQAITQNRMRHLAANAMKEFGLDFDSIPAGRPRMLPGGRVGRFGWKAQFATLEEFVAAACANELGLGNPLMDQARSLASNEPANKSTDLNKSQFHSLVAFVDTLPRPVEIVPGQPAERAAAVRGKELFSAIGCAVCHPADLGGVQGVYSDFLLHSIEPDGPRGGGGYGPERDDLPPFPSDHPRPQEWKTPPLWGVADSAPYFHDGASRTLPQAIWRHGGDAAKVTKVYKSLSKADQEALVSFLKTLKAPPDALPAPQPVRQLARR